MQAINQFSDGKSLRHGSSGPSRPPLPEKIKSKREDIMKARTLNPGAFKNATNLDQLQADEPQYRVAPPKPGEAAIISVPSMAEFQARLKYLYSDHVFDNNLNVSWSDVSFLNSILSLH